MIKVKNISNKLIGVEGKHLMPGDETTVKIVNEPLKVMACLKMLEITETKEKKAKAEPKEEPEEVVVNEPEETTEAPAEEVTKKPAKRTSKKKA